MKKLLFVLMLIVGISVCSFGQDWSLDPSFEDVFLEEEFSPDPFVVEVIAGGSLDLEDSANPKILRLDAYGYISDAPDLNLYYDTTGAFPLTISVNGLGEDLVLLVNDPDDKWFYNDDGDDGEPSITFRKPKSGVYSIWIGTYYEEDLVDAELIFSEM